MSKNIVISIPVHEEPLVIIEHLKNIQKFVPNSKVVLHASASSGSDFRNTLLNLCNVEFSEFVYINDKSYDTFAPHEAGNVTGLSTVHSSNFRYINSINSINSNFEVFALETSNDMFVRKGVEELWENYECGCGVIKDSLDNWLNRNPRIDNMIQTMLKCIEIKTVEKHAQEGTFYPKDVFKQVSDIVLDGMGGFWDSEELILHTLAYNIKPELYENTTKDSYIFHDYRDASTKQSDILSVRNGEMKNKYAVKRVPRRMDDACRQFVRELTKND